MARRSARLSSACQFLVPSSTQSRRRSTVNGRITSPQFDCLESPGSRSAAGHTNDDRLAFDIESVRSARRCYCDGAFGEGGDAAQGFDWAVKNGLMLVGMSAFIGAFGAIVLTKLRLPAFISWAFVMGLSFAIMTGGGILLGMNDKIFWSETIKQFLLGSIVGAIAGPLIQRNQMRRIQTTQLNSETSND